MHTPKTTANNRPKIKESADINTQINRFFSKGGKIEVVSCETVKGYKTNYNERLKK